MVLNGATQPKKKNQGQETEISDQFSCKRTLSQISNTN